MSDTPRTDANVSITTKEGCETIAPDFARQLERELNHWKANHDNQVKIKSTLIERPDLGDRASKIQKLIEENSIMREALEAIGDRFCDGENTYDDWRFMGETVKKALDKLLNPDKV
jgi:acetate kinase